MNFEEFQKASAELAAKGPDGVARIEWCSQGLLSSSGKINGLLQNCSFQGESLLDEEHSAKISKEIGFMLWFCSVLSDALDRRLEDVAIDHIRQMKDLLEDRERS